MTDRFGRYVVHECLGTGGMATVHRATLEVAAGTREVALKRLLPQFASDKQFVEDFVREGKLAANLAHPNIVRILEVGRTGRIYFIAMDLVSGQPLMSLMRRAHLAKRQASIGVVLSLMIELCDALAHAHACTDAAGAPLQIVHRDLTPSNLLVTDDGHLKVIDFGVAKALSGSLQTSSGMAKGKLGYMSIEAIGGKQLDTRADLFSAGVVMWELIASRRLFRATNEYDVIVKIREGVVVAPSDHNADCPTELDDIVLRALARDPDDRWPSALAMREALEGLRRYYPETARDVAKWKRGLRADSSLQLPMRHTDEETSAMRLSTEDLVDTIDQPDPLAEGSRRAHEETDDLSEVSLSLREIEFEPAAPKFKDADTIVNAPAIDRKP